jgi:hypothetical protein
MLSRLLSKELTANCMKSSKTKTLAVLRAALTPPLPVLYKPPVNALVCVKPARHNALDTLDRVNRNIQLR